MKLSTYGIWEAPRRALADHLIKDPALGCDPKAVKKALLEDAITVIIDTSYSYQQKLQREQSPLSLKERALATYEVAFATMLPSLAQSLNQAEELLRPYVDEFIVQALAISHQHADYLMELAALSRKTKIDGMAELYGDDFSSNYPVLASSLPLNDAELIEKAAKAVTVEILRNCPAELCLIMDEHKVYMQEIARQKITDSEFAEQFKSETGVTMEQFKLQKKFGSDLPELSGAERACYNQDVYFLQHHTKIEYLIEISESGFLVPRKQQSEPKRFMGGNGLVAYMAPYRYRNNAETTVEAFSTSYGIIQGQESGDLGGVNLLFSVNVLEELDGYYANRSLLKRGEKTKSSTLSEQIKGSSYVSIGAYEEICFPHPIELSKYLIEAWVHPFKMDAVNKMFEEAGIQPAFKISAYAYHPEIKIGKDTSRPQIWSRDNANIPPEADFISAGQYSRYKFFSSDSHGMPLKSGVRKTPFLNWNDEKTPVDDVSTMKL